MPRNQKTIVIPKIYKELCPSCAQKMRLKVGRRTKGTCEICKQPNSYHVILPGGK